jgi:energy-coupling factor transport system substrate-specific component
MNTNKLRAKDLITIAIFSVVFIVVYMVCSAPLGMLAPLYAFCVVIPMIPCGIVWAYLRTKVTKPLAILIQGVLFSVILFVLGGGWFVAVGVLIGGILAEIFAGAGKYKRFKWNVAGYAAFAVCFNLGVFIMILLARDYYYDYGITNGLSAEYMDALLSFVSGPLLLLTSVLSAAGAVLGMLLGRVFLKKHFVRAGII